METDKLEDLQTSSNSVEQNEITIQWKVERLHWNAEANVRISLWGYKEDANTIYPSVNYITDLVTGIKNGDGLAKFNLKNVPEFSNVKNYHVGFISVNLTTEFGPHLWSKPLPLGWFMQKNWQKELGTYWSDRLCDVWYDAEMEGDRFASTLFRCPCTFKQAVLDRGRFAPHVHCNDKDKNCDPFHKGALNCVRSSRPS